MKSFSNTLTREEIEAVADFVRNEFLLNRAQNTRYHTAENGWPDHQRYAAAFPFARGEVALDTPAEQLTEDLQKGLRLFLSSCISCHDRARVNDEGIIWEMRAVSYPRHHYSHRTPDAVSGASPYARHDRAPQLATPGPEVQQGEMLFQDNCAFCHAADGTGKNWIGSFLEPHPRDLTDTQFMATMTRERLRMVIREGLPGTGMPAWKSVLTSAQIDHIIAYIDTAFHPLADGH